MAIESPATYAEWYWSNSLDALRARAVEYEKTLAPIANTLIANLPYIEELPPHIKAMLDAIAAPTAPELDNVLFRYIAEVSGAITGRIFGHELKDFDYAVNTYLKNTRITPDVANALMLRNKISEELWLARQNAGGFSDVEGAFLYESQKPYPTLPDIITYARYHGDPDSPKELTWKLYDISEADFDLWDWLSWQKLTTEQVLSLFRRRYLTDGEATTELARLGWHVPDRQAVMDLAYTLPNAMLLVQGDLLREDTTENIIKDISSADIHPNYAQVYLDGILTKPAITDIISYELRKDPNLSNLDRELRKIGVHPNYFPLLKELAYQIPPIADIITMAVREAFTPDIAARFGQYEGLPEQFVQMTGKKGLSREWAERYWAAHWTLPSPQQGFEMLHRGIISRDDLGLLLRALDIMPFWRDKLIEMAYVPLTRVDIRRMYALGIINEKEVNKAYQDIGYNTENAARLTAFTVKITEQAKTRAEIAKTKATIEKGNIWTTAQTLSFLKKGLITPDRANQELIALGYNTERINVYLTSATK
jgi:hypothetical protein